MPQSLETFKHQDWMIMKKLFEDDYPCIFNWIEQEKEEMEKVWLAAEAGETFGRILADSGRRALKDNRVADDYNLEDDIESEIDYIGSSMKDPNFPSLYRMTSHVMLNASIYKEGDDGFTIPITITEEGELEVGEITEIKN